MGKTMFRSEQAFEEWFRTFIEEKDLPVVDFYAEVRNHAFTYTNYDVVEWIVEQMLLPDKNMVARKLVEIDFKNGDVNHFLEYLFKAFCEMFANQYDKKAGF